MSSKIFIILLGMMLVIGCVGITTPKAFAHFAGGPPPSVCPPASALPSNHHNMTGSVIDSSATVTAMWSDFGSTFEVIFALDGVSTSPPIHSNNGIYTFTFNSLANGPHAIVACYVDVSSGSPFTFHTDIFQFTSPQIHGPPVGGIALPSDITALFLAGAMTNAVWILPTIGGITGAALALFKIKRKNHD